MRCSILHCSARPPHGDCGMLRMDPRQRTSIDSVSTSHSMASLPIIPNCCSRPRRGNKAGSSLTLLTRAEMVHRENRDRQRAARENPSLAVSVSSCHYLFLQRCEILHEPVAREPGDGRERTGLLEEVSSAGDNL